MNVHNSDADDIKRIGILLSLSRFGGGTYQWTWNILTALKSFLGNKQISEVSILYFDEDSEISNIKLKFPQFNFRRVGVVDAFVMRTLRRLFIAFPALVNIWKAIHPLASLSFKYKIDILIFPGASFDVALYKKRQIFMFTDIAHVLYPQFPEVSNAGEGRRRNILFKHGIKNATGIVVDSEQLSRDIIKHFSARKDNVRILYQTIPQAIIEVAKAGVGEIDLEIITKTLPERYLFYPAQLWLHKNHANLIRALSIIVTYHPEIHLVLTGAEKNASEQLFSLAKSLGVDANITYLGYVSDEQLVILYKNAEMLVMPTFFGPTNIPTLEAFYLGCPAVISDLPGVTEQVQDAAVLFDPNSPPDIAEKIMYVLDNPEFRSTLIRKGHQRAEQLSFKNYTRTLIKIIQDFS